MSLISCRRRLQGPMTPPSSLRAKLCDLRSLATTNMGAVARLGPAEKKKAARPDRLRGESHYRDVPDLCHTSVTMSSKSAIQVNPPRARLGEGDHPQGGGGVGGRREPGAHPDPPSAQIDFSHRGTEARRLGG